MIAHRQAPVVPYAEAARRCARSTCSLFPSACEPQRLAASRTANAFARRCESRAIRLPNGDPPTSVQHKRDTFISMPGVRLLTASNVLLVLVGEGYHPGFAEWRTVAHSYKKRGFARGAAEGVRSTRRPTWARARGLHRSGCFHTLRMGRRPSVRPGISPAAATARQWHSHKSFPDAGHPRSG